MPTFSPTFEQSLHRALALANERQHKHATLEHFLLALLDDADAADVIRGCGGDIQKLRSAIVDYLQAESELKAEADDVDAIPTAGFQRVVQRAVIQVQSAGREEVNGANAFIALFAERESYAAYFLQEQDITRFDAVNYIDRKNGQQEADQRLWELPAVRASIEKVALTAPEFRPVRGKIRFHQSQAKGRIAERKAAALARCKELQRLCERRENEQPELKSIADRYAAALKPLRRDRGAYNLFLIGLELELLLKSKNDAPYDADRNPPIDGDLLFMARSLIVAHAGLVTQFPDVLRATQDLDDYRKLGESLDPFRNRLLDPAIDELASVEGIFDNQTKAITLEIKELSDREKNSGQPPSEGTTAIKHSWLRGALASIGKYIIGEGKDAAKILRDEALKETAKGLVKDPDKLTSAILKYLEDSKETLLTLADRLPSSFGWISFFLSLLGLK